MNNMPEQSDTLSRLKRALHALKDMKSKLDALEKEKTEPIAIIGMACRFPCGIENPQALWNLIVNKVDGITEVPPERWDIDAYYDPDPHAPGKMYTRYGGFLNHVDNFDPRFFGISPREACSLDPQQRLLLKVSWEALEHAAIDPSSLSGSQTGVFIGISSSDFSQLLLNRDPAAYDLYMGTGNAHSVASGRLSYFFGLKGPCLSVDTACSSSLVTIHLACQSLRNRECDLALSGGVNLLLTPFVSINHSRAQMLAPDGRCKSFDAAADGFGRSEGCGVIVLKRLSDAIDHGDTILAVIRGSAINQDGRTSGLTAPNGPSQQAVIHQALGNARLDPSAIDYVEAHGTGTSLGDPIEVNALGVVFGPTRDKSLAIGSIKANLGHLEAAAGIAGLMKVVLAFEHEAIPGQVHFKEPNPHIPWNTLPVVVPTKQLPWRRGQRKRRAGVSAFGFSGTNAHVILEEAPSLKSSGNFSLSRPVHIFTLSAKTEGALKALSERYERHLADNPNQPLQDICFTANTGRAHFTHRLSVAAVSSAKQVHDTLAAYKAGQNTPHLAYGHSESQPLPVAFLFTGQGSQYCGMGQELYQSHPGFRQSLERSDEILRSYFKHSLLEVLFDPMLSHLLDETAYTQPALFALEYSLAQLWIASWGIEPSAVLGHSVGEYVAAVVAGVFPFEQGLKLIAERGRLMQALPKDGAMAAVFTDEGRVRAAIQRHALAIAAINGPEHVVISGRIQAVKEVLTTLTKEGIHHKRLNVSHAFHSPLMEPMLADFEQAAQTVAYTHPTIDLVSNVTGRLATEEIASHLYWCHHVRKPVLFASAMNTLYQEGYRVFVEIGPKPVLAQMGRQCLPMDNGLQWLPTLKQGQANWQTMLHSLGALYVSGAKVDWPGFDMPYPRHKVALPAYPFQKEEQRYWIEPGQKSHFPPPQTKAPSGKVLHPLVHKRLLVATNAENSFLFESTISHSVPPYVSHHRVFNTVILPASVYFEMVLAAGSFVLNSNPVALKDTLMQEPLVIEEHGEKTVQIALTLESPGTYTFRIFSLTGTADDQNDKSSWTCHVSGKILSQFQTIEATSWPFNLTSMELKNVGDFYQTLRQGGIDFGPHFQGIRQLWRGEEEALGQIALPQELEEDDAYIAHPVLLDACVQVLGALFFDSSDTNVYLQAGIEGLRIYSRVQGKLWSHVRMRSEKSADGKKPLMSDISVFDETGKVVAQIDGLIIKPVQRGRFHEEESLIKDRLYEINWMVKDKPLLPHGLPSPERLASTLEPFLTERITQPDMIVYKEALKELETLSYLYVVNAFCEMGCTFKAGERFSTETMKGQLKVTDTYDRLLVRLLEILTDARIVRCIDGQWEVIQEVSWTLEAPASKVNQLLSSYPSAKAELTLLARCGAKLAQVLQGNCDPLHLLFPDGELTTAELYQDSPGLKMMNTLVQRVVTLILDSLPHGHKLRILEIGAGTGATTAHILPLLEDKVTEYALTDISAFFITQAQKKFAPYHFMRYQTLDIEKTPAYKGLESHQYDLILAANVLHATSDLRQSVNHIHQLLAPAGLLILLESTAATGWADLIYGLTDGWWRFSDYDLRPSHPLISAAAWQRLLKEQDFSQVITLTPDPIREPFLSKQAVVIASRRSGQTKEADKWLILSDNQGVGKKLAALLHDKGKNCISVFSGTSYRQQSETDFTINPVHPDSFKQLLDKIRHPVHRIVYLWSLDTLLDEHVKASDLYNAACQSAGSVLHLVQALSVKTVCHGQPLVWLVSRGAQPVNMKLAMIEAGGLAMSPLWGLGKVIALEHPEIWGGMIDLSSSHDSVDYGLYEEVERLFSEVSQPDGEDHIAFRGGKRYVARLIESSPAVSSDLRVQPDGTYLITGGFGAFGLKTAQWLAQRGAKHLVLLGRHGPQSIMAQEVVHQLKEQIGDNVMAAQADVSDETQMKRLFELLNTSWPPLKGIIHAAGLPGYSLLDNMDFNVLHTLFAPKVAGTWNLYQLTMSRGIKLDFFICYSSMVSVWGAKGQGHYVAANHFLDIFAHYGQSRGLPAMSVNWGPMTGGGMLEADYIDELRRMGVTTEQMDKAVQVLGDLFGTKAAQRVLVKIDWSLFKGVYEVRKGRWRLFECIETHSGGQKTKQTVSSTALERLRLAQPSEKPVILTAYCQEVLAKILGLVPSELSDTKQGFFDMGMDSLTAMELKNQLEADLNLSLPSTLAFDYTTLNTLVDFLHKRLLSSNLSKAHGIKLPKEDKPSFQKERVEDLSDEEVEALLIQKLSKL